LSLFKNKRCSDAVLPFDPKPQHCNTAELTFFHAAKEIVSKKRKNRLFKIKPGDLAQQLPGRHQEPV
jgi:hypothetical protein